MSTAPRLSLFRGDSPHSLPPGEEPSLDWTLLQVYESYLRPKIRLAASDPKSAGTIAKDRHALSWWAKLTGDPALREINELLTAAFAEDLAAAPARGDRASARKRLAGNTRRGIMIHLQKLLDLCGPRSRRQAKAIGLFGRDKETPWIDCPPAEEAEVEDVWRLDELAALLRATCCLRRAEWWQSLILFLYNTGQRIGTVMQATWEMVDRKEPGWLEFPKGIMKGGRRKHAIPLNSVAREAIELLRRDDSPFLLPRRMPWPHSKSGLECAFARIKAASGLPAHRLRRFAFHAIRGCCFTEGCRINSVGADLLLAHRGVSIGTDCYAGKSLMLEVVQKLPQPRFGRQQRLF
jgi:integrase